MFSLKFLISRHSTQPLVQNSGLGLEQFLGQSYHCAIPPRNFSQAHLWEIHRYVVLASLATSRVVCVEHNGRPLYCSTLISLKSWKCFLHQYKQAKLRESIIIRDYHHIMADINTGTKGRVMSLIEFQKCGKYRMSHSELDKIAFHLQIS